MRTILVIASIAGLLASGAAFAAGHGAGVKAPGQSTKAPKEMKEYKKPKEGGEKVGYSEDKIRLKGMMVPIAAVGLASIIQPWTRRSAADLTR